MTAARESDRVVVVGGGLGGLATACTLAARGYAVTLCDKNAWVGGKAAVLAEQGWRAELTAQQSQWGLMTLRRADVA